MIDFKCPTCQQQLQAQDDIAGSKVRCPRCSQKLLIPSPPKPPSLNKTTLGQPLSLNKTILGESEPVVRSSSSVTPAVAAAAKSGLRAETGAVEGALSISYPRSKAWRYLSSPWLLAVFVFGFLPWCEISCNGARNNIVPRVTQSGYQALYGGYSTPFPTVVEEEIHRKIEDEYKKDKVKLLKQIELDRSYLANVSPFLTVFWGAALVLAGIIFFVPLGRLRLRFSLIFCGMVLAALIVHVLLGMPLERLVELNLAQEFRDDPDKAILGMIALKVGKTVWFWLALTGVPLLAATEIALNYFKGEKWPGQPRDWIAPSFITLLGIGLTLVGGISQFAVYKQGLNWKENLLASYNKAERDKQLRHEAEQKRREEERLATIREQEAESQRRLREKEAEEARERAERGAQAVKERTERETLEAGRRAEQQRIRRLDIEAKKLLRAALLLDQRGGSDDQVRQQLKEIIDKYPEMPAAAQAKEKLENLDERVRSQEEAKGKAQGQAREVERRSQEAERRAKQERVDRDEPKARKLLRAALLLDQRGGFDEDVRQRLKEIIDKYPDTPSAVQAKEKLKKLDQKARSEAAIKDDGRTRLGPGRLQRTADVVVEERLRTNETELRKQLFNVPELRLVNDLEVQALHKAETSAPGRKSPRNNSADGKSVMPILHQALVNAGIQAGLPLRGGAQARLQPSAAMVVEELSKSLREMGFVSGVPSSGSRRSLPASQQNKPLD